MNTYLSRGPKTYIFHFAVFILVFLIVSCGNQTNQKNDTTIEIIPTDMPQESQPATCGKLSLTDIRPATILENEMRPYKLIGSGFCSDTSITVDGRAFVGNNPNASANSQPVEVSGDGTWMTVYIEPSSSPGQDGMFIHVDNPGGDSAFLYVYYQR